MLASTPGLLQRLLNIALSMSEFAPPAGLSAAETAAAAFGLATDV
jgi:hypothetical protein